MDALANGNSYHLTWLPIASAPPTEDFTNFAISNDHDSDESDTEDLEIIDVIYGMGQELLKEALEGTEEGDDNDAEIQLSALTTDVGQSPVSMSHYVVNVVLTHLIWPGLTYNHLLSIETPVLHMLATSSTSRLKASIETLPFIYFNKPTIAHLMDHKAMLDNACMNKGLQLLLSHLQPECADKCAIFSTYVMLYIREEANNSTVWHNVHCCVYLTRAIWIVPIHLQHPYLHWTLCIIYMDTRTI